jgi:hypothetical protein
MAESRRGRGARAGGGRAGKGEDNDEGGAGEPPVARDADGRLSVLVEMLASPGVSGSFAMTAVREFSEGGFVIDEEFEPVPLGSGAQGGMGLSSFGAGQSIVVRATVTDDAALAALSARPDVISVWQDTIIAPFACPIPPCDCTPAAPKGTMADVANYLGVSSIWADGFRGAGIVVGVVDGGITAQGRPVIAGQTSRRIPRVIGGWPVASWGTEAAAWGDHGNMTSTDVLGMAPEAQIYDLRISGAANNPGTLSKALQAYQWALDQFRSNGTPQVLSNSWGIFAESWDPTYASNPNHPFTRKVVELLDAGIVILFAAGNCGDTCPDGRCGGDTGPGRSIWGANGHPRVMTVGAVNKNEEFVGYSSQGPAALDPNKPDFCSITHFSGYFGSDSGTSAATPILAGVVALFKQAMPSATQDGIKSALKATAKDIGPAGFDQHSGAGIVRGKAALDRLRRPVITKSIAVPCTRVSVATPCGPSVLTPCPVKSTLQPCVIKSVVNPGCLPVKSVAAPCFPRPSLACPSAFGMCTPTPGLPQPEPIPGPGLGTGPAGWAEDDPGITYYWQRAAVEEGGEGEEFWEGEWPQ